jgi:protein-disulfide isomerase
MNKSFRRAVVAGCFALVPAIAWAGDFNDSQKAEIGQIVHDYLIAHPEVLIEVSKELEKKQQDAEEKQRLSAVSDNADEIFRSKIDLVAGNAKGDVTMVEFFDYNCAWCKKGLPEVLQLMKDDGKLRVVMKEFPIFGEDSEYAARAALASRKQDKYWPFHLAMLGHEGKITKASVDQIAQDQGLDLDQLKKDMEAPEVVAAITRNQALASKLAISGTPAFIIDNKVIPGYLPEEGLAASIKEVRDAGGCTVC